MTPMRPCEAGVTVTDERSRLTSSVAGASSLRDGALDVLVLLGVTAMRLMSAMSVEFVSVAGGAAGCRAAFGPAGVMAGCAVTAG